MITTRGARRPDPRRRLCLALLAAAAAFVPAGLAAAGERLFVPTGSRTLTVYDAGYVIPLGTVQLGGTPGHLAWGMTTARATQRVFTFNTYTQSVEVIDAVQRTVIGSIAMGDLRFAPRAMAASADGRRLYFAVQDRELGLIGVDLERRLLMGAYAVPHPRRVAPHPDGSRLYVSTETGVLYTVRASDMAILGHRDSLAWGDIALNEDGSRLYVAGSGLQVLDTATEQVMERLPLPFTPEHLVVSGRWAYVSKSDAAVLGVVDLVDGQIEAEIRLDEREYARIRQLDVTADGSRVVALLAGPDLPRRFAVLDATSHAVLGLHDWEGIGLICSSKFILDVQVPETRFAVTSTADAPDAFPGDGACASAAGTGDCTLRAAVQEGNLVAGTAVIEVPPGEYALSLPGMDEDQGASGDLDVLGNLTIRGAGSGSTVLDGGGLDRVLEVATGGFLRLEGVTVRNGRLPFRDPHLFENRAGAGILSGGVLTLESVAVRDNRIDGFGAAGIHSAGALRAENCTFSGNVSRGTVFSYDRSGNAMFSVAEGHAAIFAQQGEVTGCQVTGNSGETAVWIDGQLNGSVVTDNDAAGVRASSVGASTISRNRGPGCSAARIVDSTVSDNVHAGPEGCGGGVFWDDPYEELVVLRSTISGNAATQGGGICARYLEVENSTISGNAATGAGGGIFIRDCDVWNSIRSSTITANTADADADGSGDGGGIFSQGAGGYYDTHLSNTILAGNLDLSGEDRAPDCSGYLGSSQFNLVGDMSGCGFEALEWDITGTPAGLGPLADNGGPTRTHAPLAGSPAIDAGHPYIFPPADQRGVARPQDGNGDSTGYSDIGAFELGPPSWTVTASAGAGGSVTPAGESSVVQGGSLSFAFTPAEHHHVADVLVDGVSVGPVTSWTFADVTSDHTVAASFEFDSYTVTASAGAGGRITPAGTTIVPHGGALTLRVRPRAGYRVARLIVDGRNVGPRARFAINGCSCNHVIRARFRRVW